MEFTYETQGTNTYLVYAIKENDVVDTMSLGMLTNNKIPGIAPALFTQLDENKFIKYNVTAKLSAKKIFMGSVNKKRLLGILSGIVNAMVSAEEYMIDPKTLLLDMEYIFSDVSTCETILICLPVESEELKKIDYGAFFKNVVFSTRYDQTENCDYIARLINYLNGTPVFSLVEFKNILDELTNVRPQTTVLSPQMQHVSQQVKQPVVQQQQVQQQHVQPQQVQLQQVQPQHVQPAVQMNAGFNQYRNPAIMQQSPVQQGISPQVKPQVGTQQQITMPAGNAQQNMMQNMQLQMPESNKKKKGKNKVKPIPGQIPVSPVQSAPQVNQSAASGNKKKMSMLYLMRHYSKENAQIYKEQHNKANIETVMTQPQMPQSNMNNQTFAIPGQRTPAINTMPAQQQVMPQQAATVQYNNPMAQPQSGAVQSQMPQMPQSVYNTVPANFGNTTYLSNYNEIGKTVELSQYAGMGLIEPRPYLIRTDYNERILIDKNEFRIGKEKSNVDYFISDNTAISRSHARIIKRGNDYFIVDMNSTNHTFVNGSMIQSNIEIPIKPGDNIMLANEKFEFKII